MARKQTKKLKAVSKKYALISLDEKAHDHEGKELGFRVAQVSEGMFEVCPTLKWIECGDDVKADHYYYHEDKGIVKKPEPPIVEPFKAKVEYSKTGGPGVLT